MAQLHIQLSTLGVLEGRFEIIRYHVMESIPRRASDLFGSHAAFHMQPPQVDELPTYALFADLVSFEPIREGAFSQLVVCWFVDTLPSDLVSHVTDAVRTVDWDRLAVDGDY